MRATLALLLVLLAAGCGGGGGGASSDELSDEAFVPESGADFEVFASEFSFAPPFLLVEGAGTYTFAVRNDGSLPHNFTIKGVGGTEDAAPGETKVVELTLKEGAYEILCTVGDHAEQGMIGTLNVSATG